MNDTPTLTELENRWRGVLSVTSRAVNRNPDLYRSLKTLADTVVAKPLDIREYLPTARKLCQMLEMMDPDGSGSIFYHFRDRMIPSDIWQVSLLRMECRDLLEHLKAFDQWRMERRGLKIIK